MANLNKVMLIGRLTRDPEPHSFSNGIKLAAFGFAVNNRKKDQATGQWVDDPCFIDVKAWNRETGRKLADLVEQYLKKGHQAYLEGHLVMETWEDKNGGGKRSKLVVVLEDLQFLEPRSDGGSGEGMARSPRPTAAPLRQPSNGASRFGEPSEGTPAAGDGGDENIPF
jgi:single-strand DNA-binding protein